MVTWERFHELQRHALELGNTLIETRDHLIKMSDHLVKTNAMVLRLQERIGVLEGREPRGEQQPSWWSSLEIRPELMEFVDRLGPPADSHS